MPDALLLTVPGVPLLLAALLLVPQARGAMVALAPAGALPALAVALGPDRAFSAPWLLLGTELRSGATERAFLLFSGLLWLVAGAAARSYLAADDRRTGFFAGFLLAMAGNLGLLVAADVFSFYALFALMSFASYALVAHGRSAEVFYAARVYIAFVVLGELVLFAGLGLAAHAAQSTLIGDIRAAAMPPEAVVLVVVGLCVKLGIVPLHLWLPLAHAAAPVPASAVLSGAMIKAGLFGLIALLPLGTSALPEAGRALVLAGAASIGLAALIGVTQSSPKAVLAYSSVGQMGLVAVALGVGLVSPQAWPLLLPALLFFAAHHALAKGALFLGVGALAGASRVAARRIVLTGLVLPAAALAAAPFSAGAIAKSGLKDGTSAAGPDELPLIVLTLSSVATTLLMARFMQQMLRQRVTGPTLTVPWLGLTGAAIAAPFAWPVATGWVLPAPPPALDAALPIASALLLSLVAAVLFRRLRIAVHPVPPGEVLALFVRRSANQKKRPPRPDPPIGRSSPSSFALPAFPGTWRAGASSLLVVLVSMVMLELFMQ